MKSSIFWIFFIIILCVTSFSAFSQSLAERAMNGEMKAQYEYAKSLEPYFVYDDEIFYKSEYQDALKWYLKSAEQGYVPAQNQVASFYYNGIGTEINYKEAFKWYERCAKAGSANAILNLGILYENGEGTEKSENKAFQLYEKANDLKHKDAILRLARCYYLQIGTPRDYSKAFMLFKNASESGNSDADYYLGLCYLNGHGTLKDLNLATSYFKKSANEYNINSQFELGKLYLKGEGLERDSILAAELFLHAASGGWCTPNSLPHKKIKNSNKDALQALYNLCNLETSSYQHYFLALLGCYYDGAMDFSNAEKYYKMSIEKHSLLGVIELGLMYFYINANDENSDSYGYDEEKDTAQLENYKFSDTSEVEKYLKDKKWGEEDNTAYWLEKAIDYGCGDFEYGLMRYNLYDHLFFAYLLGIGIDKDLDKSLDLAFKMFTDVNFSLEGYRFWKAQETLMTGIEIDKHANHTLDIFQRLYDFSNTNTSNNNSEFIKKVACSGLGKAYYWGYGCEKPDYNKAFNFIEQAAQMNEAELMRLLSSCYRFGRGTTVNNKKADEWLKKAESVGDEQAIRLRDMLKNIFD